MFDEAIHILLIEDNPGDADLCREGLLSVAPAGSTVVTAGTLAEGLALLAAGAFDLVVADLLLPDSGAESTLAALRVTCQPGSIVVLTGLDDEQASLQALRDGASDVLIKGEVTGRTLRRALRHALERIARHRLQDGLHRAEKLQAVSRLAAGIAHHFNNLLTIILGNAELIQTTHAPLSETVHQAREICMASQRAALLTRHLLQFCASGDYRVEPLDVNAVLRSFAPTLRDALGENVELVLVLGDGIGAVETDRVCFEQSLLTLALNGRDAMSGQGRLTVSTHLSPGPPAPAASALVPRTAFVVITVSDEGRGVDGSTQAHLFEPFFTTKEVGQGCGMGLAAVHGVVQQAGGHLALASQPGQGTALSICLPALRA